MTDQQLQVTDKHEIEPERAEFTRQGLYFTPAVDICETETDLHVMVDMPGVTSDNVEIDLKDDVLSVVGKVQEDEIVGEELLTEYRTGNYFRNFQVTDEIDSENISATMYDGVLKLKLPKSKKAIPRKIPITTS